MHLESSIDSIITLYSQCKSKLWWDKYVFVASWLATLLNWFTWLSWTCLLCGFKTTWFVTQIKNSAWQILSLSVIKFLLKSIVPLAWSASHSCLINEEPNTEFFTLKLIPNALTIDQRLNNYTQNNSQLISGCEVFWQGGSDLSCLWTMNHTSRRLGKLKQQITGRCFSSKDHFQIHLPTRPYQSSL